MWQSGIKTSPDSQKKQLQFHLTLGQGYFLKYVNTVITPFKGTQELKQT